MRKERSLGIYPRDEEKFTGEYIAVVKGKIISHGTDLNKVIASAKKITKKPLLVKVPRRGWKEATILCMKLNLEVKLSKFQR